MSAELCVESDHCECSVLINNGFNCFICSVNKRCYLLNPGLICYTGKTALEICSNNQSSNNRCNNLKSNKHIFMNKYNARPVCIQIF
jgi:hypothetical protein